MRPFFFLLTALLTAVALHFSSRLVVDRDAFYHFRHAALYGERGPLLAEFPWAAYSVITQERADLWYGFHLLLAPFGCLPDPVLGLKLAGVFVLTLALALFYWSLWRLNERWAEAWPFLLLFCAPPALLRMVALRPHVLSLGFLALLVSVLVRGRAWQAAVAAGLLAWVHLNLAWAGLLTAGVVLAGRSVAERRLLWKPLLAIVGGLVAGLLLRPEPLGAARLLWTQVVVLGQLRSEGLPLLWGGEFTPRPPHELVSLFLPLVVLWAGGIVAMCVAWRRKVAEDRGGLAALLILSGIPCVLTFTHAARWSDLWKLFAVFFAALAVDRWIAHPAPVSEQRGAGRRRWATVAALLVLQTGMLLQLLTPTGRRMLASGFRPERLKPHAEWLAAHSAPGDPVFHARWEIFAELFFWNTRNRYVNGMDPVFLYARTPALYWEMHHLASGASRFTFAGPEPSRLGVDDTVTVLRRDFRARFLLVESDQRELLYYARHEPRLKLRFEDGAASVFEVLTASAR